MLKDGAVILFQGDSITDCGRDRGQFGSLGYGYPFFLSSAVSYKYPEKAYIFLNRGISGNRIVDLYARMKEDIINLKPDVLSLLIGVNDVWHEFSYDQGVSRDKFNKIYSMLLDEVLEINPEIKIVLIEPFILKAGEIANEWDKWFEEIKIRREIVKNIAEKYNTIFIPIQEEFDKLCKIKSPEYWAADGVHPTNTGHIAISYAWRDNVFDKIGIGN